MGASPPASDVHKRLPMWHVNDFDNSDLIDFIKYRQGNYIKCRRDLLREAMLDKTSLREGYFHDCAISSSVKDSCSKRSGIASRSR